MFKKTAHSKSSDKLPTSTGEFTGFSEPSTVGSEKKAGLFFVPKKNRCLHLKKTSRNLDLFPCGFPITQTTNLLGIRQILSTCARPSYGKGGPQWPLCLKVNPPKKNKAEIPIKTGVIWASRFTRLWVSLLCVMHAALLPNSPHPPEIVRKIQKFTDSILYTIAV